jgi:hypothetical protein
VPVSNPTLRAAPTAWRAGTREPVVRRRGAAALFRTDQGGWAGVHARCNGAGVGRQSEGDWQRSREWAMGISGMLCMPSLLTTLLFQVRPALLHTPVSLRCSRHRGATATHTTWRRPARDHAPAICTGGHRVVCVYWASPPTPAWGCYHHPGHPGDVPALSAVLSTAPTRRTAAGVRGSGGLGSEYGVLATGNSV